MKNQIKIRINFSGRDFQDEFNGYDKSLPTWEEVSEEVDVTIEDGNVVDSTHKLSYYDRIYAVQQCQTLFCKNPLLEEMFKLKQNNQLNESNNQSKK